MEQQQPAIQKLSKKQKRKLKRETPITSIISRLSHDGRGIDDSDGKIKFIFNALPGETTQSFFIRSKSSFSEYQSKQVLANPNQDRQQPFCQHYDTCGGCQLQHLSRKAQRKLKQNTLIELIQHQTKTEIPTVLEPLYGAGTGYRHKARLGVKYLESKNEVVVGFRERFASRFITKIHSCQVLADPIGEKISVLKEMISQLSIKNKIPQIEVAISDNASVLIIRHLQEFNEQDLEIITKYAKQHNWRIILYPNPPQQLTTLYPKTTTEIFYRLEQQNITYQFHPQQFTQINPEINNKMVNQAMKLLCPNKQDTCLDLYCGIGNFSLALAKSSKFVVGVEGTSSSVSQARKNAALNNISNVEFHTADLSKPIDSEPWANKKYSKLLLDPARPGAAEIIKYLKIWQPEIILYVSCNPATLARDSKSIIESGYIINKAGIIDMFPHTAHVESIIVFSASSPPQKKRTPNTMIKK